MFSREILFKDSSFYHVLSKSNSKTIRKDNSNCPRAFENRCVAWPSVSHSPFLEKDFGILSEITRESYREGNMTSFTRPTICILSLCVSVCMCIFVCLLVCGKYVYRYECTAMCWCIVNVFLLY